MRRVAAVVGFVVIAGAYLLGVMLPLVLVFFGDYALSNAEIAAGVTRARPSHLLFLPAVGLAMLGLAGLEWAFLRWVLPKRR